MCHHVTFIFLSDSDHEGFSERLAYKRAPKSFYRGLYSRAKWKWGRHGRPVFNMDHSSFRSTLPICFLLLLRATHVERVFQIALIELRQWVFPNAQRLNTIRQRMVLLKAMFLKNLRIN